MVGELENIREALLDRQFPGAKDFLPVNIRLQSLERARGVVQVGIGHGWQRNDGMVLRQDDAESLENTKNLLKLD